MSNGLEGGYLRHPDEPEAFDVEVERELIREANERNAAKAMEVEQIWLDLIRFMAGQK